MDYQTALQKLVTAKSQEQGKPIANNTRLMPRPKAVAVKLHDTDVVTFHANGAITLNTGGWKTVTTKARINEFSPFKVWSERGTWYVHANGTRAPFADGVTIRADGKVIGAGPQNTASTEAKTRKRAAAYAKAFIDALYAGKIPAPSGGDCWGCCLKTAEGKTVMGSGHIEQHLSEKYFVPSLLVNAMREFGASKAAEQTAHAFMQNKTQYAFDTNRNGWIAKQLQKMIRRYVLRSLGLAA